MKYWNKTPNEIELNGAPLFNSMGIFNFNGRKMDTQ